ncbi:MAG: hypothetical protein WKF67_10415 [Rubrobacteraceae bacterium]
MSAPIVVALPVVSEMMEENWISSHLPTGHKLMVGPSRERESYREIFE